MIRAFVAIPVPDEVASVLTALQAGLPCGRPVPPENFHITLAFLGKHPEPLIEDVHSALDGIRQSGLDLKIEGLGVFGEERPRALFAKVVLAPELASLRKKVRQAVRSAGVELSSQKFVPHVTLARFGTGATPSEAADLQSFMAKRMSLAKASFWSFSFALYESHLRSEAPIYEALAEYPLSPSAPLSIGS
ncbi:MAG: RNA 2',3'-cyclic phosphodiesterase [Pseudomonadota bacterium]